MATVDLPPISAALAAYSLRITQQDGKWGSIMQDVAADKAKKTAQKTDTARFSTERTALDGRYGQIGISAVAAAARYQGAAKNPAYAPVAINWYDRAEEAA